MLHKNVSTLELDSTCIKNSTDTKIGKQSRIIPRNRSVCFYKKTWNKRRNSSDVCCVKEACRTIIKKLSLRLFSKF